MCVIRLRLTHQVQGRQHGHHHFTLWLPLPRCRDGEWRGASTAARLGGQAAVAGLEVHEGCSSGDGGAVGGRLCAYVALHGHGLYPEVGRGLEAFG